MTLPLQQDLHQAQHHHAQQHHAHHHGTTLWQRWLQAGIVAGLAVYFSLDLLLGGGFQKYINTELEWLIVLAAVLLILLAIAAVWEGFRLLRGEESGHSHGSLVSLVILALPLLLAALSPEVPLGADAARGRLSTSVQPGGFATLQRDPLDYHILDWLRAFAREADLERFAGQEANLLGFVYRELDYPDDLFLLARITLSCCVADASAVGLPVRYPQAAELPTDQWLQLRGRFQMGIFANERMPILQVEEITWVEPPEQPYLYP